MNIRFLPFLLISSLAFAQEDPEQAIEPIITDLDRLVESVKKTASSRSAAVSYTHLTLPTKA